MAEHYTRNTVSVTVFCARCGKFTTHRVDSGHRGPCEACIARLDAEAKQAAADKAAAPVQYGMFGQDGKEQG